MILESIAIDYRCGICSNIRRVDARSDDTVRDLLPAGWATHSDRSVVCGTCAPRHSRADERREAMRDIRMPQAQVYDTAPPTTDSPSPLASDRCHRCGATIGETESWRPDPQTKHFAKVHRRCL